MAKKNQNLGTIILVIALLVYVAFDQPWSGKVKNAADVKQIIEEYIEQNPDKIVTSLQAGQAKIREAKLEEGKKAVVEHKNKFTADNLPFVGNKNAKISIVEFFDYNCGYCKKALGELNKVIQDDKDIKIVFIEYPIFGPSSEIPAKAALAVNKINKEKYFEFHSALMEMQGQKTEEAILDVAKKIGLNPQKVKETMADKDIADELANHKELGAKLNLTGTPAFIIGDELVPGFITAGVIKDKIAKIKKS